MEALIFTDLVSVTCSTKEIHFEGNFDNTIVFSEKIFTLHMFALQCNFSIRLRPICRTFVFISSTLYIIIPSVFYPHLAWCSLVYSIQ